MNDDLNTPRAVAALFGLVTQLSPVLKADGVTSASAMCVLDLLIEVNGVLGILYPVPSYAHFNEDDSGEGIPQEILELVKRRSDAKAAKDWTTADECRDAVASMGFKITDVKGGDST